MRELAAVVDAMDASSPPSLAKKEEEEEEAHGDETKKETSQWSGSMF